MALRYFLMPYRFTLLPYSTGTSRLLWPSSQPRSTLSGGGETATRKSWQREATRDKTLPQVDGREDVQPDEVSTTVAQHAEGRAYSPARPENLQPSMGAPSAASRLTRQACPRCRPRWAEHPVDRPFTGFYRERY
jgi:hypothetical protein